MHCRASTWETDRLLQDSWSLLLDDSLVHKVLIPQSTLPQWQRVNVGLHLWQQNLYKVLIVVRYQEHVHAYVCRYYSLKYISGLQRIMILSINYYQLNFLKWELSFSPKVDPRWHLQNITMSPKIFNLQRHRRQKNRKSLCLRSGLAEDLLFLQTFYWDQLDYRNT